MPLWVPPIPRYRPPGAGAGGRTPGGTGGGTGGPTPPGKPPRPGQPGGGGGGAAGELPWWQRDPPANWIEIGPVRRRKSVKLDASGNGSVQFEVFSANHRWLIYEVVVNVSGASPGTFPQVTLHVGSNSAGLSEGASWTGNQETFQGQIEMNAADDLSVDFTGGTPSQVATAIIEGVNYLWR